MIDGLEKFRSHFAPFSDRYVLIGGAAASLVIEDLGGEFRTTKDLDIVLVLEALDRAFAKAFREFVRMGGYEHRQTATGRRQFYRFHKPAERDFPFMLELFSRVPDALELRTETGLTPIPVEDELASLSAILMDEAYYRFVLQQRTMIGGVPVIPAEVLIPLKARAYTDLSQRRAEGQAVDSKHIKKHLRDVFRLYAVFRRRSLSNRLTLSKSTSGTPSRRCAGNRLNSGRSAFLPQPLKPSSTSCRCFFRSVEPSSSKTNP